ncbi:MAG: tyrosine-type recombinase/integrase [Acidobacteriota bacterium]
MGVFVRRGKRGTTCYIDYYVDAKRVRERLGNVSRKTAEDVLKIRQAEIIQGRYQIAPKKRSLSFEDFSKDFREYLASRKEGKALKAYQTRLKHLEPAFGRLRLSEISPFHVEKYICKRRSERSYRKSPVAPATINRELAVLKRMFQLAIQWGRAEKNPVIGVKFLKEECKSDRVLSQEEEQKLFSACAPHVGLAVLLALHTGMRLGEILNLRWQDIDLRRQVLTVVKSKSGKMRSIPTNDVLAGALTEYRQRASAEYVFWNDRTGKPMLDTKTGYCKAVRRAGISHCRFHDLRHTFATRLVTAGVDLATVSQLLGHSSIEMTMRYAHPSPENKRRAVDLLCDGHKLDTSLGLWQNEVSAKSLKHLSMRL